MIARLILVAAADVVIGWTDDNSAAQTLGLVGSAGIAGTATKPGIVWTCANGTSTMINGSALWP
jgi:hypothetical protein